MHSTTLYALAALAPCSLLGGGLDLNPADKGGYLVVKIALQPDVQEHAAFAEVAREVAAFHSGRVVDFDGLDWLDWSEIIQREAPDEVLFVVPPDALDVALHRRLLLSSAQLDDDPLPDFTFGYFTARDAEALRGLWERTLAVHGSGLNGRTWYDVGITTGMKSRVYPGSVPELAGAAGFEGDSIYIATLDADPDHMEFVEKQLPRLREAAVIEMTGNGDPEGIWLFPGARNLDRDSHWDYAAERVGEDPGGEMPRLTADSFRGLGLRSPVVWSGTCHSAATRRVFVEGDIVSTFGRTDGRTVHLLPPERSLCLAMIDAGAVAFLAPIGPNHGMSVSRERDAALSRGCTLGEAIKSTYDDVFLAAGGPPRLDVPVAGISRRRTEPIMQGGGCNRILIGDPALRPFSPTISPTETVIATKVGTGADVALDWSAGWHSMAWDMFGTEREADWRVVARVPLDEFVAAEGAVPDWTIGVASEGEGGDRLPYRLRHAVVETWRGQRWLHLQANAPRSAVERKAARVVFRLRAADSR